MAEFAKLHDGVLELAPVNGYGYSNFNQSEELMREYGYKPYEEEAKPDMGEGNYSWKYVDEGEVIRKVWSFTPYNVDQIKALRGEEYKKMTDELCAEYTRKSILGTLTEERKIEIEESLANISASIAENYPYPEDGK